MKPRSNSRTPTNRSKLSKLLGASNPEDTSKKIIGGEYILQPAEYSAFWTTVKKERIECARYLARIIKLLVEYEKDPHKVEKTFKKTMVGNTQEFITILLHTIQYLDMFVDFDASNESFVSAMDKFEQHKRANSKYSDRRIFDVLNNIERRRQAVSTTIIPMLLDCTTLESIDYMVQALNGPGSAATSPTGRNTGSSDRFRGTVDSVNAEFSFTFARLARLSRSTEYGQPLMDEVLKQLSKIPALLTTMPQFHQSRALALLLVLKELITQSPTGDLVWLSRACDVVGIFYKWPRPYGIIARDMLDFLALELRAPGDAMRRRILTENSQLHPNSPSGTRRRRSLNEFEHRGEPRGERLVHIFYDARTPVCRTFKNVLSLGRAGGGRNIARTMYFIDDGEETEADESHPANGIADEHHLKVKILTHIFDCDFKIVTNTVESDPLGLLDLSEQEFHSYYTRAFDILRRAKEFPVSASLPEDPAVTSFVSTTIFGASGSLPAPAPLSLGTLPVHIALGALMPGGLCKMFRESMLSELLVSLTGCTFLPRRADPNTSDPLPNFETSSIHAQPHSAQRTSSTQFRSTGNSTSGFQAQHKASVSIGAAANAGSPGPTATPLSAPSLSIGAAVVPPPVGTPAPALGFVNSSAPPAPELCFHWKSMGVENILSTDRDTSQIYSSTSERYHVYPEEYESLLQACELALRSPWLVEDQVFGDNTYTRGHASRPSSPRGARMSYYIPVSAELPWRPHDPSKACVRVLLMGSNLILHHYVCAFVALKQQRPELFNQIEIQLFVVPAGRNDLATFVANTDLWYRRHVYALFAGPLGLCPQFPVDDELPEGVCAEALMSETLPVQSLRSGLQDFVRQAQQVLPVCVFECLCWTAIGASAGDELEILSQARPDMIIPFVCSLEVGLLAQAEAFRRRAPTPLNRLADVLMGKDFEWKGVELNVSYIPSSMSGAIDSQNVHNHSVQKSDKFSTLTLTNLPESVWDPETRKRSPDAHLVPNAPNMRWLVLHSRLFKGGVASAFEKVRRRQSDVDAALEALRDPLSFEPPAHVGLVDIAVANQPENFMVMLDGELFGPFKRLRVQASQALGEERVIMPIMTFFPVTI